MEPITVGSLFTGIGGLDLGLERAGMRVVWQCEIDDYATRVLEKRWPDVPRHRDVRGVGAHSLPEVDLICGGFPCQPHSTAGKRAGAADDRDLWPEYARLIRELRPRWVLAENVPGLLSTDAGRFFGTVLRDLATLGYDAEWSVLSACALGAPHTRERLFIVAHANGTGGERRRQCARGATLPRQDTAPIRASWAAQVEGLVEVAKQRSTFQRRVRRGADGLPSRLVQLRGLGNAVVPAAAQLLGRYIIESENTQ